MPDHDLFVWAGRACIDASHAGDAPLGAVSRWSDALRFGHWHRVNGLLATELARRGEDAAVPSEPRAALRASAQKNLIRSLRLRGEFARLLDVLAAADINVMALKGAALTFCDLPWGYSDPSVRPMNDLDVLVEPTRLAAAFDALSADGYRPLTLQGRPLAPTPADHHHHPPMTRGDGSVVIELHHHIVPPAWRTFAVDELWDRARPARAGGRACFVPAPRDLLLHLCLHFAYDRSYRAPAALMQLTDIGRVVALADGLQWDAFASFLSDRSLAAPAAFALASARELLGAAPPGDVIRHLAPPALDGHALQQLLQHRVLPVQQSSMLHLRSYFQRRGLKRRLLPASGDLAARYTDAPRDTRGSHPPLRVYGQHVMHAIEVCARPLRHPRRAVQELRVERNLEDICRL